MAIGGNVLKMNSSGGCDVTRGKALKMNTALPDDVTWNSKRIRMKQILRFQLNPFDDGILNWKRRFRIDTTRLHTKVSIRA